jgi:hypothetical protein
MPKIKNWSSRSETSWRHDNKKQGVVVKSKKPKYTVELVRSRKKNKVIGRGSTKSEAKQNAREWMKNHPQGI